MTARDGRFPFQHELDYQASIYMMLMVKFAGRSMQDITSEAIQFKKTAAALKRHDLAQLGDMFANCLIVYHSRPNQKGMAASRLRLILQEWKRRRPSLPDPQDRDRPEVGVLKSLGYGVGGEGQSAEARRLILDYLMQHNHLPPVKDRGYMDEWGLGLTSNRFHKTRRALNEFIKAHAHSPLHRKACREWRTDVVYLETRWWRLTGAPSY